MDFKNVIDWKSFIMGAAFASFICVVASQYQLDWLYAFAAIGLLYVGYKAKTMVRGAILGAIAATPLFVLAEYGVFGPLSKSSMDPQITMVITLIAILLVGGLVGFVGAYTYKNRQKAIAEQEKRSKIGKNKTKNKKGKK
jgi:amino acid permease